MMGTQYIMGQAGVPFYAQQPVYSFEELQLLQQRIPHMTTGYYDIPAYQQAPTSLATQQGERGLASVAYSMSNDGRFTRADNNASPVPSTISQQISVSNITSRFLGFPTVAVLIVCSAAPKSSASYCERANQGLHG